MSKNASLNSKCITILILSLLLVATFIIGYMVGDMRSETIHTVDTVLQTKVDTLYKDTVIEKTKYVPKEVVKLRTDTITKDTILEFEQKIYEDTLCNDKDSIILKSFISGVSSKLDSTSVAWKKHTEIITNYVEITKYIEKPKTFWNRFHIQPQITSGYDLINHKWGIMGGIGVGIDIGGK